MEAPYEIQLQSALSVSKEKKFEKDESEQPWT